MARVKVVLAAVPLLLLAACEDSLPTAPSDLKTGLVIYEDANFLGESAHITRDVADLRDFKGPCEEYDSQGSVRRHWNNCISSIRIAPGWLAAAYRDDHYSGQFVEVTADVPNLQLVMGTCDHDGLNDCITSIRVFRP